ncbi:glycosyltransferase [Segetibacter sp. 3557_3]|uniref:glycosyltransferase family 2 protein n=1 Tax=Segetibacter sp. 3557_3 TaxID=2547429 RepID=UPI0010588E13|nr:glycosyltransferase family 2 protein [Segetibacter sp. 3557_3]TDH23325.1 glycosyltransferase [Segetibacter sp. 3557_3]
MTMVNQGARITIITAVFNAAAALEETIQNVRELNYTPLDVIVVDGGSTDGTLEVIKRYPEVITKWVTGRDSGVYDAMNKGWELATHESYVLFLGAGDKVLSLPAYLSTRYDEVVFGQVYKGDLLFKSVYNFKLKLGNTLHHQGLLVPRRLHIEPPFDLSFPIYADFDFNQRLDKMGATFRFDEAFKGYAMPGGISAVQNDREMSSVVQKNYGWAGKFAARLFYSLQKLKSTFFFKES